ncbi:MAG TPA: hypothetical protein VHB79_02600 [Polyangiaceae bacterium]|nr:hypothetical protein [Polyangiaceae bacterium]
MRSRKALGIVGLLSLIALNGCGPPDVQYGPATAANAATKSSVGLSVSDDRSSEHGRGAAQIGQVRGGFGIPQGVDDKKPDVIVKTVTDATTDALHKSAVGVQSGGPKKLVAKVKEFWFDGFMGFQATVTVAYQLTDATGKELWKAEVTGKAGDSMMNSSAKEVAETLLPKALADMATHASEQFNTPAFQQALAM